MSAEPIVKLCGTFYFNNSENESHGWADGTARHTIYLSAYTSEYTKLSLWGNMFPMITQYSYYERYQGGGPRFNPSWAYDSSTGALSFTGYMSGGSQSYYSTCGYDVYVKPGVITGY